MYTLGFVLVFFICAFMSKTGVINVIPKKYDCDLMSDFFLDE